MFGSHPCPPSSIKNETLQAEVSLVMRQLLAFVFASGMALAQAPSTSPSMAVIGDNRDVANSVPVNDGDRLLADLLPQARGKSTLIGGTIESLDHVRDRFVVRAFGGRNIAIIFDNRTRVY